MKLTHVPSAFKPQSDDARVIQFSTEGWSIPSGGHLQGIQRMYTTGDVSREYFIISGSSDHEAYLIVVGGNPAGHAILQKKTISYDPYRHAGGIQIIGDYLVVGIEDNLRRDRSRVCFFDITNPEKPIGDPIITIQREGQEKLATAGAVAIVRRPADHLLIAGSWDSDTLDFYKSNGIALAERDSKGRHRCEFTYWRTWNKDEASKHGWCDGTWGNYQNLNLLSDVDDRLFLLGYYCNAEGEDYVDLYSLDLSNPTSEMLRKEGTRRVKCKDGASFEYAGGAYIADENSLISYACEKNCRGKTVINEFR